MSELLKRLLVLCVLLGGALAFLIALKKRPAQGFGPAISLLGYTNLPNNSVRFAMFSVLNHDSLSIRWRGYWVEVEGDSNHKVPIMNPGLPQLTGPTLNREGSLALAVGEPSDEGRWRVCLMFSRYTVKERLRDFAFKHKLPLLSLGPPQIYTNISLWLTK